MTPTLEKAARAAKKEVDRLRRTRVPEYPGSWKTHEGLSWQNLDEVSEAVTRAVLLAIREPDEGVVAAGWLAHAEVEDRDLSAEPAFTAMIDAITGEETA